MFKEFKKDKITKFIQKEENNIYKRLKSNDINFLEAHYILENKISQIYNENNFSYQDLLKRRRFLTSFRSNIKNIMLSLVLGMIASATCSFIIDSSKILSILNPIIYYISMAIITSLIVCFFLNFIPKCARNISEIDFYNVNSFELKIIDNILQEYEDKRPT
ncbi:MAG: hypothetical protein PUD53_06475 [Oscillospiraceae bacterium]|nr:hypothetical protein [Oscillospiraceae bacterium]